MLASLLPERRPAVETVLDKSNCQVPSGPQVTFCCSSTSLDSYGMMVAKEPVIRLQGGKMRRDSQSGLGH